MQKEESAHRIAGDFGGDAGALPEVKAVIAVSYTHLDVYKRQARHCTKVSSRPISYWEDVAPDGLFLAWLAER